MRSLNLALVIVPPIILWLLVPAFVASTYSTLAKGSVIGLFLSLSFIGIYELGYSYVCENLTEQE